MKTFMKMIQLIPLVTALVRATEEAIPGSGTGSEKLNFALNLADMVYQNDADLRAAWPEPALFTLMVTGLVSSIVGSLNRTGHFAKG